MKALRKTKTIFMTFLLLTSLTLPGRAQETKTTGPSFDVGGDLVSNYVWRGTKFGSGPAIQPYVAFTAGNFTLGSWGSFCFSTAEAAEADLYLSYGFDFGLSLSVTDYYFPGTPYFDYSDTTGSHGFELNTGYELGGLSIAANYMLNEAGNAGTAGGDLYFELGYSFSTFGCFIGAGDGWHTPDGSFAVCNLGLTAQRSLQVTETFTLPLSGTVVLNPETEQFYVVLGVTL